MIRMAFSTSGTSQVRSFVFADEVTVWAGATQHDACTADALFREVLHDLASNSDDDALWLRSTSPTPLSFSSLCVDALLAAGLISEFASTMLRQGKSRYSKFESPMSEDLWKICSTNALNHLNSGTPISALTRLCALALLVASPGIHPASTFAGLLQREQPHYAQARV